MSHRSQEEINSAVMKALNHVAKSACLDCFANRKVLLLSGTYYHTDFDGIGIGSICKAQATRREMENYK